MVRYGLALVGLLFLVWTAYTSLTQVRSHERAVIRRFGRILEQKPQQGLYIGLPWGIDRVDLAPVGPVRTITVGFSDKEDRDEDVVPAGQLLTGDHNLVNVEVSLNFKVREKDMERYVLQQDSVDAFVARAAEALIAEWIAGRRIDDVLRHGKSELPRFLQEYLQDRIEPYGLGVEFEQASIKRLTPPDQVKDAFDKLAQAQTGIRTQINQAEEQANRRKTDAATEAEKILKQADSYKEIEIGKARTEADNFSKRLAQYRELSAKNPGYLNAYWLDEWTRVYARMKSAGRIELLDHYLTGGELSITQFPLQPRKK
jgi:membrane protease subunit HflK